MKLLLKLGIVIVLVAVGYTFVDANMEEIKNFQLGNPSALGGEESPAGVIDQTKGESKSELDAIFMYLPFLGFQFEDVVSVDGSDLSAVAGRRFVYQSNVLEVYQLENSASAADLRKQVKDTMKVKRTVNGKTQHYVAVTMNQYICLLIDINDPVALLESYEFAKKTMKNLGIQFE